MNASLNVTLLRIVFYKLTLENDSSASQWHRDVISTPIHRGM